MQIWLARIDPLRHRFRAVRPPFATIDAVLETRSLLVHDLAHYAVEAELATQDGFFGLLAAGLDIQLLREHQLEAGCWERLMAIEFKVVQLQTAFKRGDVLPGDGSWRRLRSLHGAWSRARFGEALTFTWSSEAGSGARGDASFPAPVQVSGSVAVSARPSAGGAVAQVVPFRG